MHSERRLYTVSLPPEGYIPCLPELTSCTKSEKSSSSDDTEDQDPHEQLKRKRTRQHKSKKKFKNPNSVHVEQAELEKQKSLVQEKLQPQHTDGTTISKNKKRKLKKKQQIKRKKAAGLLTKASGVNFMYQPEESNSEQDVRDIDGEDVKDTKEEDVKDIEEEGDSSANEKADAILNLLKSTREIYFYDGISGDSDSTVFMETTEELFKHLESHKLSPSDVFILDHMKTLLLLQDIERLKSALEMFPEHCMMPPDQARVISTFFNYWITHILPEKSSE
ncbi:glutamate-rich protein 1 isoform X2 [Dasypus novemcinctus]|nr:glutamate-rich protein 1 isoform X2 [Dasypus novemcinctus]